jgi:hypothetical protein
VHISSAANAYPAADSATATSTTASPASKEHGYPAPAGAKDITPTETTVTPEATAVTPQATAVTPTYMNYLPIILAGQFQFGLQSTGVIATQGFAGCSWTGVAGQVFSLSGDPIANLIVHLQGVWNGQTVNQNAITGSATEYGPAGYVFVLGTQPIASSNALSLQLRDATPKTLSTPILFSTYADCAHNLILINFTQNF